ncbi:MAG: alpha-L-fucosidase, partial [Bacteroidota bacterium]|nr:alpha-L-fucosidase [Bacteroidota bacterium]
PTDDIIIKNLGTSKNGKINKTSLLGSKEVLKWKQEAEFLKIQKPGTVPNSIAIVFKVYQK